MIRIRFVKTILLTSLALIAFAANSVLCRLALGSNAIDAASFTGIRLLSGVIVLFIIITAIRSENNTATKGSWTAGFLLFVYAVAFSYAYNSLDTGTGALILFGAVQITMIALSMLSGSRLHPIEMAGVSLAFAGFVYLVLPGISAPSTLGFLLMTVAGSAWGIYTLMGRSSKNPLGDTAYNFLRTTPFVVLLLIATLNRAHITTEGILYAVISGSITSGIGYTIWYIALGGLSATLAAVLQLSVPVIAAIGGVIFVSESLTSRLILSSGVIFGGILLVVLSRSYFSQKNFHLKP